MAEETTWAEIFKVDDAATALALPLSVKVHDTAPVAANCGPLHCAVTPFGNPDAAPILDPAAPLATVIPPFGVAVTVTCADASESIETETGEATNVTPGAGVTAKVTCLLAVRPAPAAVTVIGVDATLAADETVKVNVCVLLLEADAGVCGFADQVAVTPLGKPVTLQVMLPVKEPPVVAVRLTAPFAAWATLTALDAADRVSVGGRVTVKVYETV